MKLIAHRGNLFGSNIDKENHPDYIDNAISLNYDVEIDIRITNLKLYLGHDNPQYQVSLSWLIERLKYIWIHCKNIEALEFFSNNQTDFNYFWHQNDDFTLTSKNYIWTYPGKSYTSNSIIVMPENTFLSSHLKEIKNLNCFGVCSDHVGEIN